tara:strand:+ start:1007 stop:1441 length:435 start_codon:yes stop_codon:yes gene_type:complete
MKKMLLVLALITLSSTALADSYKETFFYCEIKDITRMGNGKLIRDSWTKTLLAHRSYISYFESNGYLQTGDGAGSGNTWKMKVVQKGSRENSSIGVREYHGLASSGVDTIRIQTWAPGMPFMYTFGDEIYTGNCKLFRNNKNKG